LKERLIAGTYEVTISKWLNEAWNLYCHNWIIYSLFTLLIFLINCIPYVGGVLAFPFYYGFFITGMHFLRMNPNGAHHHHQIQNSLLLHGWFFFFPLIAIAIIYSLAVGVGVSAD